jgi:hypothetical protein
MNTEKELRKIITAHLLLEGMDARAIEYVLDNYDLTSYVLETPLKVITSQVIACEKAVCL